MTLHSHDQVMEVLKYVLTGLLPLTAVFCFRHSLPSGNNGHWNYLYAAMAIVMLGLGAVSACRLVMDGVPIAVALGR